MAEPSAELRRDARRAGPPDGPREPPTAGSLEALYQDHGAAVMAIAAVLVGEGPEATELARDVFVTAGQAAGAWDAPPGAARRALVLFAYHRAQERPRRAPLRSAAPSRTRAHAFAG